MLDLAATLTARAVLAALRLGIFEALDRGALSLPDLAAACAVSPVGVERLVGALSATGYLQVEPGGTLYGLTPMTRTWMLASGSRSMADLFAYYADILGRWDHLEEAVRQGRPPVLGWQWLDAHTEGPGGAWDRYHAGLRAVARVVGPEVVQRAALRGEPRRLLDLGGGHGLYSVLFCQAHPGLTAVVLDWPSAKSTAAETIERAGLGDRVRFCVGSLEELAEPEEDARYDVLLAFNFVRLFSPDRLAEALVRIRNQLSRNGQLVILDEFGGAPAGSFAEANHQLVLLELFNSTAGHAYTPEALIAPLEAAGFAAVTHRPLKRAGGLGLVTAVAR